MPTTLYLIRHGQTATNRAQIIQGWNFEPLNTLGRWQAERTGARLAGVGIAALYASPLERARETAQIIGAALGCAPVLVDALREVDTGRVSGMHGSQFMLRHPRLWAAWLRDDPLLAFPGGDTMHMFNQRAADAVADLVARHAGQALAAVAHGGTIAGVLAQHARRQAGKRATLRLRNCAICTVQWDEGGAARLLAFNDTAHLH